MSMLDELPAVDKPSSLAHLEQRLAEAQAAVTAERARLQRECPHPVDKLTLSYSGVSSYKRGDAEHGITIRCTCGREFAKHITIYGDL